MMKFVNYLTISLTAIIFGIQLRDHSAVQIGKHHIQHFDLRGFSHCDPCKQYHTVEAVTHGEIPLVHEFPFIVSIQDKDQKNNLCSGVLLSSKYVLTAASCVVDQNGQILADGPLMVIGGTLNLNSRSKKVSKVASIYVPPQFIPNKSGLAGTFNSADIAVLKLSSDVFQSIFDDKSNTPLVVDTSDDKKPIDKKPVKIAGFGEDRLWGGPFIKDGFLRATLVRPKCQKFCDTMYMSHSTIDEKVFCAAATDSQRGVGAAKGDEGLPYIIDGKIVGILSDSSGIHNESPVGLYTRVASHAKFIFDTIHGQELNKYQVMNF